MNAPIGLFELSPFIRPPAGFLMAILKGWFDNSQTTGKVWAIGRYIGAEHRWAEFDRLWPLTLANHGVPYFHMKEMGKPRGVYSKWQPPQEHQGEM